MQVKKFEAKSMKEAIEMVKTHLGPEAIILSARDSHRGFGLMGEKSVEVTAAVSDETLRKKKIAESRLREELREKFYQVPASKQKEYINRVFQEVTTPRREMAMAGAPAARPAAITEEVRNQVKGMRYIDILDEDQPQNSSTDRVRRAAERARQAGGAIFQEPRRRAPVARQQAQQKVQAPVTTQTVAPSVAPTPAVPHPQVQALESQVSELKALVERFQKMPQMPMSMHPGAEQGLPYEMSGTYQRLTGQGIHVPIVTSLLRRAQKELDSDSQKKPALVDAWVVQELLKSVNVVKNPIEGRYHVFVGTAAQGKTSSLVKLASHLVMREKRTIAIVSMDSYKVGAADQLRIYAQILNVPFAIVRNPGEWAVAEQKLKNVQHILVDAPGLNLRTMEEADWLKRMLPPESLDRRIHYVQSILARDEETIDLAGRYQMLGFHDVIFTRLDESSRQGLILNFQDRFKVPLHSFGTGSRIPEDYEFVSGERVVDLIFKLSRLNKKEV